MKQWITLIAVAASFASCTKENLKEDSMEATEQTATIKSSGMRVVQNGAYVSDWEQYGSWNRTDEGDFSTFGIHRKTPEVTSGVMNGGLVMSYAKYTSDAAEYAPFANATSMPFYYLPEAERPIAHNNYFSGANAEGDISIAYSVRTTKQEMPEMGGGASLPAMKFQYVVMDKTFLTNHGLDAQTVQNNYSYEQVMQLLNEK